MPRPKKADVEKVVEATTEEITEKNTGEAKVSKGKAVVDNEGTSIDVVALCNIRAFGNSYSVGDVISYDDEEEVNRLVSIGAVKIGE